MTPIHKVKLKDSDYDFIAVMYNGHNTGDVMEFLNDVLGYNDVCYIRVQDGVIITCYSNREPEETLHDTWFVRTLPEDRRRKSYSVISGYAFSRDWIITGKYGTAGKSNK